MQIAIFCKNVWQHIQTSCFVSSDYDRASRGRALIGHGEQRFVTHLQQPLGICEQHSSRGSQSDIFSGAVQQTVSVFLLKLAYLCAYRGLRTKYFLSSAGEAAQLGYFQERD